MSGEIMQLYENALWQTRKNYHDGVGKVRTGLAEAIRSALMELSTKGFSQKIILKDSVGMVSTNPIRYAHVTYYYEKGKTFIESAPLPDGVHSSHEINLKDIAFEHFPLGEIGSYNPYNLRNVIERIENALVFADFRKS